MPFIHPEIQVGEVFLGNVTRPFNTTWRTIRYGETAYSGAGSPIGPDWNLVPCFILASEVRRTISAIKINYPNNWRERVAPYEAMLKEEYLGDPENLNLRLISVLLLPDDLAINPVLGFLTSPVAKYGK